MNRTQDALAVLRGLRLVLNAACKNNEEYFRRVWYNSNIKEVLERNVEISKECATKFANNPSKELEKMSWAMKETFERTCVVVEGLRQFSLVKMQKSVEPARETPNSDKQAAPTKESVARSSVPPSGKLDTANLDISSITLEELEQMLAKHSKNREISLRYEKTKGKKQKTEPAQPPVADPSPSVTETKVETSPTSTISQTHKKDEVYIEGVMKVLSGEPEHSTQPKPITPKGEDIKLPELSSVARQRKVPSSRIGRMASFGSLFAGLGIGTFNELAKGALGLSEARDMKGAFFNPANAKRIVDTLCRVRGAALKLGQILSIQDSTIISPELVKAFERVRQAADYMPDWQVERVMVAELGSDWRKLVKEFSNKPFAAASIGQVHRATLPDGMEVAIKIQYPGVAQSIESDIDNLVGMLKVWDVFPAGFFIDNVVKVAKRELNWEVDYIREAEYTEKYAEMISGHPEYYVPKVIWPLTTKSVLTTELVPGVPLDKCFDINYEERKFIGQSVLKLCLRELFELQCMQTDPNWSNFLYDAKSRRLMLIDFGSTRFYSREFINNYREIIIAAANGDREKVLVGSRDMGFLTGYETKQMEEAHVDAVMILGEIFRSKEGEFDFGKQNTTKRIAQLVPTMVAHRLCPPPEEIYSIHRKLSGVFLLCSRVNIQMDCRKFYEEIVLKRK